MKKLFFYFFSLFFFNFVNAADINESNFLDFLSKKNYFSAAFIQTIFKDNKTILIKKAFRTFCIKNIKAFNFHASFSIRYLYLKIIIIGSLEYLKNNKSDREAKNA